MMISVENLTKRYGAVTALDGLTFAIEPGVVGLVGANGAGKSTMIKILLGLLPATAGNARVLDLDVATDGPAIRQRVGYMPEHDCLPADMSATEFVLHMARMSGLPLTAARERTADTLRHVGLYEERYRSMGGYSTGMKQRVKLAQALVHDPGMLLLDEPTNGLDPAGRDQMLALMRRIGTEFGIPMLVTSHLLGELEQICDHIVVVDGGRLLRSTTTADVTSASRVLAVEVDERMDEVGRALQAAGLVVHPAGRQLEIELADESTYDRVLDVVVQLGVGLHRMERRRHRMAEIFRADPSLDPALTSGAPADPGQAAAAALQQQWAAAGRNANQAGAGRSSGEAGLRTVNPDQPQTDGPRSGEHEQ
nr:ABC transporter ATP-binding protein [Kineosporia sp. NBRC 101677]